MSTKINTKILNLLYILPIVITTIVFYWDGMQIYLGGPCLGDLLLSEDMRQGFYLFGTVHVRAVKYALLDLLKASFGLNPLPYHVVPISIHITNSILVFYIAKKLFDNRLIGLITALLFSTFWAHPETLIKIEHVHEELLASFTLCTLISFYNYRQNPTKLNYFLILFFAVLAMGTKESAPIILVPLIYLTDRYIALESLEFSRTRLSKAPYIPLLLLSLGLLAYLRFGPTYGSHVQGLVHYDKAVSNFVRWISFTFCFPLLSNEPRWGNVNLILLALFYFFSPIQMRDRISLLMAANVLLAIPTAPLGSPGLRYLYLSSFFSMTMFAFMLYHGVTRLVGIIKVKEDFGRVLVIVLCTLLIYHNYFYVNKLIEYYNRASGIPEKVIKMVSSSFPNGTLNAHLIFVNFPLELKDEHSSYPEHELGVGQVLLMAYYGQNRVGQVSRVNLLEAYDGRYKLPDAAKNISPSEFENLTKEKGNRVYFFNSKDDSIHDVTGKDFLYVKRLINQGN